MRSSKSHTQAQDDATLIALSQDGDSSAFSALISRYEGTLLHFISKFAPVQEDAEDICQESFKRAFLALKQYDSQYSFTTWLFSITRNVAIDHFRKRNIVSYISIDDNVDFIPEVTDIIQSPEDNMIGDQTYKSLIELITSLPPIYRDVAQLRYINEYAYQEIADQLKIPLNTVRTRLSRARAILSSKL